MCFVNVKKCTHPSIQNTLTDISTPLQLPHWAIDRNNKESDMMHAAGSIT